MPGPRVRFDQIPIIGSRESVSLSIVDMQQPKGNFQQLLRSYNPLVYLPLNESSGTPVDHASSSQIGPPGGAWSAFTTGSPAPQTINLPDGNNFTYGNPGPTSDGRTCIGWSALSRMLITWAEAADMPMMGVLPNGTVTSVLFWMKIPASQGHYLYSLNGHGSTQTVDIFDGPHPQWQQVVQDSGANIYASSLDPPIFDGLWHLIVENWWGNRSVNTPVNVDLYIDGSKFGSTQSLGVSGGNFSAWGFNPTGMCIGGNNQTASGITAGAMQDFAVFPGGTNACNPLGTTDIALLWGAR